MTRHIMDGARSIKASAPLARYAKAARSLDGASRDEAVCYAKARRRVKGTYDPSSRVRAYLRIERGFEA